MTYQQSNIKLKSNIKINSRKVKKSLRNNNVKYLKVNNILDDLIKKYKKNPEFSKKLKNPFANCLTSFDIIKKLHGDENMILGVLSTYKFYKPLSKSIFIFSKKDVEDYLK